MTPGKAARFAADLGQLTPTGCVGIAVSGGPDSLALLLLTAAARPGEVEAATVDHRLRPTSRVEAEAVAAICEAIAVPHTILTARWTDPPTANVQARSRDERYALLAAWAAERDLTAIATAHHADDQAETLLMRLARGSGVSGLAGARPSRALTPGILLVRPLLAWRKTELEAIVTAASLAALDDPSNRDPHHDRARLRDWLAHAPLNPERLAASATWLRDADDALDWSLAQADRLTYCGNIVTLDPENLPRELQRRLLLAAFTALAAPPPRGPDLVRALDALTSGATVTLSGLKLTGGLCWTLAPAPSRARRD